MLADGLTVVVIDAVALVAQVKDLGALVLFFLGGLGGPGRLDVAGGERGRGVAEDVVQNVDVVGAQRNLRRGRILVGCTALTNRYRCFSSRGSREGLRMVSTISR